MNDITADDVGSTIKLRDYNESEFNNARFFSAKVIMFIKGPSGGHIALFESHYKYDDYIVTRQCEAIRLFMEREAAWLKLQAETQSSQKTVQS